MKRYLLVAALFFFMEDLSAQFFGGPEIFSQDFSNGIPANWTILDIDGNTQIPFLAGQGYTGAWQYFHHPGKNCVAVGTTGGTSNDYLITPAINLPAGQYLLAWNTSASSPFSQQDYEVRISTTTPDAAGMNANSPLQIITNENPYWTKHQVNISAYAGQTVYIGFHSNGGGWSTFLDDVSVSTPVSFDASVTSTDLPEILSPGSYSYSGTFWNAGVFAINSYNLNWNINNGAVTTVPCSSVNIPAATSAAFSVPLNFTAGANGTYLLKVWASALNGNPDMFHQNDTLVRNIFVNTFPKKLLVEEFTQAGCMPCAAVNPYFDGLIFPNLSMQKIVAVKYHPSWPGFDQMYNDNPAMADNRVFYYDVPAVPEALVDGKYVPDYNATWTGDPAGLTQQRIDSAQAVPAIFDISITNTTVSTTNNVSVTVTAKTDVPFSELRLFTVIIEDSVNFSGMNGEEVFYQVARKMLPADSGQALPAMSNNQSLTYNFSYPVTAVYDASLLRTVAFVTDNATLKTYQAAVSSPYPVGINEIAKEYEISAYPNPATENIFISVKGIQENKISWSVKNVLGETIFSQDKIAVNGEFDQKIDVSGLAKGIYFFTLQDGDKTVMKKIVVR